MGTPNIQIETINPRTAEKYLTLNVSNRPLRKDRVSLYAEAMRNREWRLTGEALVFNTAGDLLNGQHRLLACIEANTPFQTLVVRGVADEAYDYMDSGVPRSVGDIIDRAGILNAKAAATAARIVSAYEAGFIQSSRKSWTITRNQLKDEVEKNNDLYQNAIHHGFAARKRGYNGSALTAFHILLAKRYGTEAADEFVVPMITGAGLEAGDPRLALMGQVMGPNRPKLSITALALMIRTWNAWRQGGTRKLIKGWNPGMPFPAFED